MIALPPLDHVARVLKRVVPFANHHVRVLDLGFKLMGPRHADFRALLLSDLTGEKVPKAKAGVNNLERDFWQACRLDVAGKSERQLCEELYNFVETLGLFEAKP